MTDQTRRTWRAAPATLVAVTLFAVAAVVAIPALAYLVYQHDGTPWIPAALGLLTLAALVYAWRCGLHPRLRSTDRELQVVNPFRRHTVAWEDVTVLAAGENGLVVGSLDAQVEAWCIQKSNWALRRGRLTRADRVVGELMDIWDRHDPPLEDEETGLRIRRARPDESRLLARLEKASSEDRLQALFPGEDHPFPVAGVTRRWRRLLRDRLIRVHVLEQDQTPVGFVAFGAEDLLQLGVLPHHTRRGYSTALLEYASSEMFEAGAHGISAWVLMGDSAGRAFFASHHWSETPERRPSVHPPRPELCRLVRRNPAAARRSR